MTFLSWTGSVWVRIPLETYIFILNFSLPPRSEQVNGAVANEMKHVHSPEVIVVFRPQIQLIIQGFVYIYLQYSFKAILQVLIYKALYDKSYLGSKTTMTSGEWTCLISFATAPLTCSERGGSEKFKMKIYVSSGIRTLTPPVHDR